MPLCFLSPWFLSDFRGVYPDKPDLLGFSINDNTDGIPIVDLRNDNKFVIPGLPENRVFLID